LQCFAKDCNKKWGGSEEKRQGGVGRDESREKSGEGEKDRKMGDVWDDLCMMIILAIALFLAFAIGLAVVLSREGKDSSNDQKTP
jgi:hypothetical protein